MATPRSTSSKSTRKTSAKSSAARDASSAASAPSSKPPRHEKASASTSTSSDSDLVVAQVLGAHGIRGELKCRIITDFPQRRFKRGTRLLLGSHRQPVTVRTARIQGNTVLLQLDEVADRTEAEKLRGLDLAIPPEEAGRPPKGEYFWHEVIGLTVVHASTGEAFGEVKEILETGANDVYVVRGDRGEILVPATKEVVKLIDPPAGHMLIEPLPGMIPHQ